MKEDHKSHFCVDEYVGNIKDELDEIQRLWSEKNLLCEFVKGDGELDDILQSVLNSILKNSAIAKSARKFS